MESIKTLREICQSTRPSIFSDLISRFYYTVSIYLTWACLKLGFSANQVTILSGVVAIIGGVLIATGHPLFTLLGAIAFHLFAILDMSDGEVARYRKQGGMRGHFLDWFMHFIASPALIIGISLSALLTFQSRAFLVLTFVAVLFSVLDKTITNCAWTVICWTRMREIKRDASSDATSGHSDQGQAEARIPSHLEKRRSYKRKLFFFLLTPMQDRYATVWIFLLALLDYIRDFLGISAVSIHYQVVWIFYLAILGPLYLCYRIYRLLNNDAFELAYRRLFVSGTPISFPEADFL